MKYTLIAMAVTTIAANAAVSIIYDADPDNDLGTAAPSPATQGWEVVNPDLQASTVDNTGWQINDSVNGSTPQFRQALTLSDFQSMHDNGWTLSATVRVQDTANFFGWGITGTMASDPSLSSWTFTERERVALNFVEQANGTDVRIGDLGSDDGFLVVGGMGTYIDLEIVGQANSMNYEVFIDGISRWSAAIPNGSSNSSSDNVITVSSGSSSGINRVVDYASVGLVAVPEPSSTALLGLGGLALILRRRK